MSSLCFEKLSQKHRKIVLDLIMDADVMKYTPFGAQESEEAAEKILEKWINVSFDHSYLGHYAVFDNDSQKYIGWGMLCPNQKNELYLGYMVNKENWGKGLGSQICKGLLELPEKFCSHSTVFASVESENIASVKILEKAGMCLLSKVDSLCIYRKVLISTQ